VLLQGARESPGQKAAAGGHGPRRLETPAVLPEEFQMLPDESWHGILGLIALGDAIHATTNGETEIAKPAQNAAQSWNARATAGRPFRAVAGGPEGPSCTFNSGKRLHFRASNAALRSAAPVCICSAILSPAIWFHTLSSSEQTGPTRPSPIGLWLIRVTGRTQ
jgi:hypothetical protein